MGRDGDGDGALERQGSPRILIVCSGSVDLYVIYVLSCGASFSFVVLFDRRYSAMHDTYYRGVIRNEMKMKIKLVSRADPGLGWDCQRLPYRYRLTVWSSIINHPSTPHLFFSWTVSRITSHQIHRHPDRIFSLLFFAVAHEALLNLLLHLLSTATPLPFPCPRLTLSPLPLPRVPILRLVDGNQLPPPAYHPQLRTTCPSHPVSPKFCADAAPAVHSHPPTLRRHPLSRQTSPSRLACLHSPTCLPPHLYHTVSAWCHIWTIAAPFALIQLPAMSPKAMLPCV
jgi:hypothetical protein